MRTSLTYVLVILCLILWSEGKVARRDTDSETEDESEESDEYNPDEAEYSDTEEDHEDEEFSGYAYTVVPPDSDKNHSGLLILENIVASVIIEGAPHTASLCQRRGCESVKLDAPGKDFMYWQMNSNSLAPVVFKGDLVGAKCIANIDNTEVAFVKSDGGPICEACIGGDVIICENEVAGIMLGDKTSQQKFITVDELLNDYNSLVSIKDMMRNPEKPAKSNENNRNSEKLRSQNSTATIPMMTATPTVLLFIVSVY